MPGCPEGSTARGGGGSGGWVSGQLQLGNDHSPLEPKKAT